MIRIIITIGLIMYSSITFSQKQFVLVNIDTIYSNKLGENRILNIYLTEGYNEKDTIKFSVIYLLDGSADEDFIHILGLV